ncbi:MAG: hypothetical protein HRU20_13590 [Pseudomonadales bacterium]|nr:hypothetical protein [Pseudomonadales bacterium]
MEDLLTEHGITSGCFNYQYQDANIDWWPANNQTAIIETGIFESDNTQNILLWIGDEKQRDLAFQTTFINKDIKRTFIHEHIGRDHFGHIELAYDDEAQVFYTDSYDDSLTIAKQLFAFISHTPLTSKEEGDTSAFSAPKMGDELHRFAELLDMNKVDNSNTEQIQYFFGIYAEFNGGVRSIAKLNQELETISAEQAQIPQPRYNAIKEQLAAFIERMMDYFCSDYKLAEGDSLNEEEKALLQGLVLKSDKKVLANFTQGLTVAAAKKALFKKLRCKNRNEFVKYFGAESSLRLE